MVHLNYKHTKIVNTIMSQRLVLINATVEILEKILTGNDAVEKALDIFIPDQWTEFGRAPFEYSLNKIKDTPSDTVWWSWLPILVTENMLIGNCGYKGPPVNGTVEIGYEVAVDYRQQGFATEIAKALIENAFRHPDVDTVVAHTLPEENESVHVLQKCGFRFSGEIVDPDDGLVWRWERNRPH
jgi:[ribosomal protein S5]-alanine N-acetyltransferase